MTKWLQTITLALLLCGLFATAPLLAAQEATVEAGAETQTEEVPDAVVESAAVESEGQISETAGNIPGVSAAMLFLGAGAIVLVGLLMIARDSFRGDTDSQ